MSDFRIETRVTLDDGSDGVFWRKGERWLREHGKEYRILDLAANLEAEHMTKLRVHELQARDASK